MTENTVQIIRTRPQVFQEKVVVCTGLLIGQLVQQVLFVSSVVVVKFEQELCQIPRLNEVLDGNSRCVVRKPVLSCESNVCISSQNK